MAYKRKKQYNEPKDEDLKKVQLYLKKVNELHVDKRKD